MANSIKIEKNIGANKNKFIKIFKALKNTADGETVTLDSFSVPQSGIYLIIFSLSHCGANRITKQGAFWSATLKVGDTIYYPWMTNGTPSVCLPIPSAWDNLVSISTFYRLGPGVQHTVNFLNQTGINTDTVYDSRFSITAVLVAEP